MNHMAQTFSFETGAVVGRRYRLDRPLGRGGMGEVYAATHLGTGAEVALKILAGAAANDAEHTRRFLREARAITAIRHPNVVRVDDVFEDELSGRPVMVMELLQGETLAHYEARVPQLPLREVAQIFAAVARGVAAAHDKGVVHRDLKPDNIFLCRSATGERSVRVLDFGVAKLLHPAALGLDSEGLSTQTGMIVGTPQYMAPEQVLGEDTIDARTDVWALAVTMVEALSGKRPFRYATYPQMVAAFVKAEPISVRRMIPELPAAVADLLEHALRVDRRVRCASVLPFIRVLDACLLDVAARARPRTPAALVRTLAGRACLLSALMLVADERSWADPSQREPAPSLPLQATEIVVPEPPAAAAQQPAVDLVVAPAEEPASLEPTRPKPRRASLPRLRAVLSAVPPSAAADGGVAQPKRARGDLIETLPY
jgi:eukaryotic-like serine/threonine-protein kinase